MKVFLSYIMQQLHCFVYVQVSILVIFVCLILIIVDLFFVCHVKL